MTHFGFGCSKQAMDGHKLCANCREIAFGPMWREDLIEELAKHLLIAYNEFLSMGDAAAYGAGFDLDEVRKVLHRCGKQCEVSDDYS